MDKKVLIVEDDRIIAMCLESSLGSMGYRVIGNLSSPHEAIGFIEKHRPGAVLMAVSMDDCSNAIGTAEHIKEKHGIPVVFLSTLTDYKLEQRASKVSWGMIISKPFDDDVLQMVLEGVFKKNAISFDIEYGTEPFQSPLRDTRGIEKTIISIFEPTNLKFEF